MVVLEVELVPREVNNLTRTLQKAIDNINLNRFGKVFELVHRRILKLYQEQLEKTYRSIARLLGLEIPGRGRRGIRETVGGAVGGIGGMLGKIAKGLAIFGLVAQGIKALVEILEDASPLLAQMLKLLWQGFMLILRPIGDFIAILLKPIIILLYKYFIIPWYKFMYGKVIPALVKFLEDPVGALIGLGEAIVNKLKEALPTIAGAIVSAIPGLGTLLGFIIESWPAIESTIRGVFDFLKGVWEGLSGFISWIWGIIEPIIKGFFEFLKTIWDGIVGFATWIWSLIEPIIKAFFEFLKQAWEGIKGFVSWIWDNIRNAITTFFNFILNAWITIAIVVKGLWNTIQSLATNFFNWLAQAWSTLSNIVGSLWNVISSVVTSFFNQLMRIWNSLSGLVMNIFNWLISSLTNLWNTISFFWNRYILPAINGIINAVLGVINAIREAIDWVKRQIQSIVSGAINTVRSAVSSIVSGARSLFGSLFGAKQTGGFITREGLYYLHRGEYVVPAPLASKPTRETTNNFNIYINIEIQGKVDEKKLVEEIKRSLLRELHRYGTW